MVRAQRYSDHRHEHKSQQHRGRWCPNPAPSTTIRQGHNVTSSRSRQALDHAQTENAIAQCMRTAGSCMGGFATPSGIPNPSPFRSSVVAIVNGSIQGIARTGMGLIAHGESWPAQNARSASGLGQYLRALRFSHGKISPRSRVPSLTRSCETLARPTRRPGLAGQDR